MSNKNLLILGDTSTPEALGSKLERGFNELKISKRWTLTISYNSPAEKYSPSMKYIAGKIFYKLNDKRSWEWNKYQKDLIDLISSLKPDLVLATGVLPLKEKVFKAIHKYNGYIANYLTDDPWNPIHKRKCFLSSLKHYDHIFSTKKKLGEILVTRENISASWLPFAYDPYLHYPIETAYNSDVVFIGTGDRERLPWLNALDDLTSLQKTIHGNSWKRLKTPGWQKYPEVQGEDYCKAISGAKIVLGLLRAANGDLSTDRSYEIGAIGGCGLYQDTKEHRDLLPGYPDIGFFKDPDELREKVQKLIGDENIQSKMRTIGSQAMQKQGNTYSDRLKTMLEWQY